MSSLSEVLGLTPAALESRLAVLQLTPADRERLAEIAPLLEPGAEAFIDRLYTRLLGFPPTASWFTREGTVARLK
ncbi:MAG: hypothetical protein IT580_22330, partial [Verrucomicrobiales bacterium]|nr:hypothetical protein [Verrucomicrobiales bacterium]